MRSVWVVEHGGSLTKKVWLMVVGMVLAVMVVSIAGTPLLIAVPEATKPVAGLLWMGALSAVIVLGAFRIRELPSRSLRMFFFDPSNDSLFTVFAMDAVGIRRGYFRMLGEAEEAMGRLRSQVEMGAVPDASERIIEVLGKKELRGKYVLRCKVTRANGFAYEKRIDLPKGYANLDELMWLVDGRMT